MAPASLRRAIGARSKNGPSAARPALRGRGRAGERLDRPGIRCKHFGQSVKWWRRDALERVVDDRQQIRLPPYRARHPMQQGKVIHLGGRQREPVPDEGQRKPSSRRQRGRRRKIGNDEIGPDKIEQMTPGGQKIRSASSSASPKLASESADVADESRARSASLLNVTGQTGACITSASRPSSQRAELTSLSTAIILIP